MKTSKNLQNPTNEKLYYLYRMIYFSLCLAEIIHSGSSNANKLDGFFQPERIQVINSAKIYKQNVLSYYML